MRLRYLMACGMLQAIAAATAQAADSGVSPTYAIVDRIPGHRSLWDQGTIDPQTRRLYLAGSGVMAVDLTTRRVTPQLVPGGIIPGGITHDVCALGEDILAVSDNDSHSVKFFKGTTGKILATIPTGHSPAAKGLHDPDLLFLDPKTGFLIAVNGESGTLALIDIKKAAVVDTIAVVPIGNKLEAAAADGKGLVYINIETQNSVGVVDILNRKLIKKIPLKGCEEPTGLAYDATDQLVMSVCGNGVAKFIDTSSGAEVASLAVGKGADALLFDPLRRVAFSPGGDDGTLSVIAVRSAHDIAVTQTLPTQEGALSGVFDAQTGRVYLPVVKYDLSAPPLKLPGLPPEPAPIPDSFQFLVVASRGTD